MDNFSDASKWIYIPFDHINEGSIENAYQHLKSNPSDLHAKTALAIALANRRDYDRALELMNEAYAYDDKRKETIFVISAINFQAQNAEKAIHYLQHGISLYKDDPNFYWSLGFAYNSSGRRNEARQEWEKVLKVCAESIASGRLDIEQMRSFKGLAEITAQMLAAFPSE